MCPRYFIYLIYLDELYHTNDLFNLWIVFFYNCTDSWVDEREHGHIYYQRVQMLLINFFLLISPSLSTKGFHILMQCLGWVPQILQICWQCNNNNKVDFETCQLTPVTCSLGWSTFQIQFRIPTFNSSSKINSRGCIKSQVSNNDLSIAIYPSNETRYYQGSPVN